MNQQNTDRDSADLRFGVKVTTDFGTGKVIFAGKEIVKVMMDSGASLWLFRDRVRVTE